MIDIKLLRANPDKYIQAAKVKRIKVDIPALLDIDARLAQARQLVQNLRTAQNTAGKTIATIKDPAAKKLAIAQMADTKAQLKQNQDLADELEPKFNDLMLLVPQLPAPEVPEGKDDTENVVMRHEGEIPKFDFPVKDHMQLGAELDIIDMERGVKLAGSRNYVLKGAGAMLHQAILRLAIDQMIAKGYTLLTVPVLVNESVMYGTGYFPLGREQAYLAERDNMSLVGTAEVPTTAYYSDEILSAADLPKKFGIYPKQDCTPLFERFLDAAARKDVAMELNTAGLRKDCREIYPSPKMVQMARAKGVAITFGSDAHAPGEVGMNFTEAMQLARASGYTECRGFTRRRREMVGF